jgi:3-hydroxybutyryl-CoA dehydrogenase
MKIVVLADENSRKELLEKSIDPGVDLCFINDTEEITAHHADAVLLLNDNLETYLVNIEKPVIINSATTTLHELKLPGNYSRINGWHGFLKRELWEIATNDEELVKTIFEVTGWKYSVVADEPGLVAGRIVAMLINEAWFAFGDNVSSKEEIDNAMRLGTNYPYGPFEWGEKIGLDKIFSLLNKLLEKDNRYEIAPALSESLRRKNP